MIYKRGAMLGTKHGMMLLLGVNTENIRVMPCYSSDSGPVPRVVHEYCKIERKGNEVSGAKQTEFGLSYMLFPN